MLHVSRGMASAELSSAHWTPVSTPVVPLTEDGALKLGQMYLDEVGRATARVVRPRMRGESPALSLLGLVDLIAFGAPQTSAANDCVECRFSIASGVLVAHAGGALKVVQRGGVRPEVGLVVEDYAPRLAAGRPWARRLLYDNFQARLHAAITTRFLARMRHRSA